MKKMQIYSFKIYVLMAFLLCKMPVWSNEKLIFVHIPKSGGVSVSSLLMNEYDSHHIHNTNFEEIYLYSYGFHRSLYEIRQVLPVEKFKLITFLRHPIDRVLSEHKYCMGKHRGDPNILLAHRLPSIGDPLETASNEMCKILSGLNDQNRNISIAEHLDAAKKSLQESFFFIGITEKMDESIHLLYSLLQWDPPQEILHFNSSENTEVFSQEVIEAISERNWADIELYRCALELYDQQKKKILPVLKDTHSGTPYFIDEITYSFHERLAGCGWGIRENTNNACYRWVVEKNEAAIDFALQFGEDYIFQASILIQPALANELKISVLSTPLSLQILPYEKVENDQYTWVEYRGSIPKELIQKDQKTKIVFQMPPPEDSALYFLYLKSNPYQTLDNNYRKGKFACKKIKIVKDSSSHNKD